MKKPKMLRYIAMLGLALLAVGVTAVSTFAWFQVNSVTYDAGQTVNAGSANLTVGDVYGYKAVRQADENGNLAINGDSVTKKQIGGEESTTNTGSGTIDTDLNVPLLGDGYYIVERHDGKFLYDGYSAKMEGYTYSGQYTLDSFSFKAGAVYRFMHYSNNGSTVNTRVAVTSVTGSGASESSGDLLIDGSAMTRKLWFNANTGAVGIESVATNSYSVKNARFVGGRKNAYGILDTNDYFRVYLTNNDPDNVAWTNLRVHYWGGNESTINMTLAFKNGSNQDVYVAFVPTDATGFQFIGYRSGWSRDVYTWNVTSMPSVSQAYYMTEYGENEGWKAKVTTWNYTETFYTYYFNNLDFFTTPRAHVWANDSSTNGSHNYQIEFGTMNNAMENMTQVGSTPRYSVTVPYWSSLYTHIIFYQNNSNRTVDLTNISGNNGKTFEISSGSGNSRNGTWRSNPSGTTHTYNLVDFGNRLDSGNTLPKVQVWDSTNTVYTPVGSSGMAMTQPSTGVRIFQTPALDDSYNKIKFTSNNGSNSTNINGESFSNSNAGQYFEINNGSGTSCEGRWTVGAARTTKNAAAYTKTIYLYDPTNALQGEAPKLYAWDDDSSGDGLYYTPADQIWPGVAHGSTITGTYFNSTSKTATIYSWTISGDYTKGVFNNGGRDGDNQTGVLTLSDGQVFELNSRSAGYNLTGTWRNLPSDTDNTYYLYDVGAFGSAPYAYAWKNDGTVVAFPPIYGKAHSTSSTVAGKTLYSYQIPDSYDRILFSNGTESKKTATIDCSSKNNKVFVITSVGNNTHVGKWYNAVSALSGSTYTVYLYDRSGYFGNTPYLYASHTNHISDGADMSSSTFYYPYQNASSPGVAMSAITSPSTVEHGFYATIPVEYDSVRFFNSGSTVSSASHAFNNSLPYFITQSQASSTVSGTWSAGLKYVIQQTSYFIYDGSSYRRLTDSKFEPKTVVTNEGLAGSTFEPADYTATDYIADPTNGIYYKFQPEADNWYTDPACSSVFSTQASPSGSLVGTGTNIYKKMICDTRQMVSFYVDMSGENNGVNWPALNVYAWESADDSINNSVSGDTYSNFVLGSGSRIAQDLYQLTLPKSMHFRFNGGAGYTDNYSSRSEDVVDAASNEGKILYLEAGDHFGSWRVAKHWGEKRNDFIGDASLVVTHAGGQTPYTMGIGDIEHNYFTYERGVDLMAGDSFVITVSDPNVAKASRLADADVKDTVSDPDVYTFNSNNLSSGSHGTSATYIVQDGDEGYDASKITVKSSGRYTVYLTSSGDIQLVSVPVLGNGYYIMPYTSTTDGYIGASKMTSVIENGVYTGAYYNAYKATPTMNYEGNEEESDNATQIYIRSYINAVDKGYKTTLVTERGVHAKMDGDGVITLMAGTYNIRVNESADTIYISSIAVDDFFALDPLFSNKSIAENFTSLVYEIEFTTTNDLPIKAAAEAESMPSYLGFALYASTSPITQWNDEDNEDAPYLYMRANYLSQLVAGNQEFICDVPLPANNGLTTYYAYIIIDYIGTPPFSISSHNTNNIAFYLKCVQA